MPLYSTVLDDVIKKHLDLESVYTNVCECIKRSTHYLGDKLQFDVSSEGSTNFRRGFINRLGSESILSYICRLLSATHTGHGFNKCL